MRKYQGNFKENSKGLNLQGKQKIQGFKKGLRMSTQLTDVISEPQKLVDVQQHKMLELQYFKKSKLKIQQVINQSKIKNGRKNNEQIYLERQKIICEQKIQQPKQQEEYIPCPFCAQPLLLIDLEHIQTCKQGKKCSYCEEKYPLDLFNSHLLVCQKRPSNKFRLEQQFPYKRIKTQAIQNFSKRDKYQIQSNKKESLQYKQMHEEAPKKIRLGFERKYSSKRLPYSLGMKVQPVQLNKGRQDISQNIQAPINYSQYFNQVSRLRAEKQKGFSKQQLRSLKTKIWDQKLGDCVICSENYRPKVLVIMLPCSHFFHQDCLLPWLQSSRRCPTCRKQI